MCGIAGIYNRGNLTSQFLKEKIILMSEKLKHRGPDDFGFYYNKSIAFGHRRLSIIDLSENARQPLFNETRDIMIIFNGEFYNYKEFRRELLGKEHKFISESDSEVILHLYEEYGFQDTLNKINGMFSIAIWDGRKKKLYIARDRFGIKPLYYVSNNDFFAFASEIKAFENIYNLKLNNLEVWDRMVLGPKIGGKTVFSEIYELEPGHFLSVDANGISKQKYYSLFATFSNRKKNSSINYEYLEYLLKDSVKLRLVSDVKLGTLNSGGLDSSFVSALAKKQMDDNLHTFSVAPYEVRGRKLPGDETYYANIISEFISSKHHVIRYSIFDLLKNLPNYIIQNDEFLYHSNSVPLSIMLKEIKSKHGIYVLLGGEGADEVFRGYYYNKYIYYYLKYHKIPYSGKIFSKKFIDKDLESLLCQAISFPLLLAISRGRQIPVNLANELLEIKGEISDDRIKMIQRASELDEINQAIYYEQKNYLGGLLHRIDRMSMMWGVEVRVPFLDHRIVNEVNKIDFLDKYHKDNEKILLKKIATKYIPSSIVYRKKYGFSSSIDRFKTEMKNEIINKINIKQSYIDKLNSLQLFPLLNYIHFREKYL